MRDDQKVITYKGRSFNSSISSPLTDSEMNEAVEYIYRPADEREVDEEIVSLASGGVKISAITRRYFLDLMYETRNGQDAWSIKEACEYKPILEYFNGKCDPMKHQVMAEIDILGERIETAFRLCGIRAARKVAQFPISMADRMIGRYCPLGGNYYDPSCGWGARMLSALHKGVNYFGTDPNKRLVERLYQCSERYNRLNPSFFPTITDIRATGSENRQTDWLSKMDFAFTSPPYFGLEIYQSEGQSYTEGMSYADWLDNWMRPTADNILAYLKPHAYCAINIKDVVLNRVTYPLERDTVRCFSEAGFRYVGTDTLEVNKRVFGNVSWDDDHEAGVHEDADENIYLFQKP
jgi:hypothetical protein